MMIDKPPEGMLAKFLSRRSTIFCFIWEILRLLFILVLLFQPYLLFSPLLPINKEWQASAAERSQINVEYYKAHSEELPKEWERDLRSIWSNPTLWTSDLQARNYEVIFARIYTEQVFAAINEVKTSVEIYEEELKAANVDSDEIIIAVQEYAVLKVSEITERESLNVEFSPYNRTHHNIYQWWVNVTNGLYGAPDILRPADRVA